MGLIADLDEADARRLFLLPAPQTESEPKPAARPRPRWVPRRCRRHWIARDTPIVPDLLADEVCHEVSAWLGVELPRSWRVRLAVRADVIYHHNRRFRRGVCRRGSGGLDYLRMFMRHWLAALVHRHRPDWFKRLPSAYGRGSDLPAGR